MIVLHTVRGGVFLKLQTRAVLRAVCEWRTSVFIPPRYVLVTGEAILDLIYFRLRYCARRRLSVQTKSHLSTTLGVGFYLGDKEFLDGFLGVRPGGLFEDL